MISRLYQRIPPFRNIAYSFPCLQENQRRFPLHREGIFRKELLPTVQSLCICKNPTRNFSDKGNLCKLLVNAIIRQNQKILTHSVVDINQIRTVITNPLVLRKRNSQIKANPSNHKICLYNSLSYPDRNHIFR